MEIPEAIAIDVAEYEISALYGEDGEIIDTTLDEDTGCWKIVFSLSSGLQQFSDE